MSRHVSQCSAVVFTGLAVIVWANAAAQQQFCVAHPISVSCDNPIAPGPDYSHEPVTVGSTSAQSGNQVTVAKA